MGFLNRLGMIFALLFLFVVGTFCIFIFLDVIKLEMINNFLQEDSKRSILAVVGLLFWLIVVLVVYTEYVLSQEKEGIFFTNPLGEVSVSRNAIEDYIKKICEEENFVRQSKVKIKLKKRGVLVETRHVFVGDNPIPESTGRLQEKIKVFLEETVGVDNIAGIKVSVMEIAQTVRKIGTSIPTP